MTSPIDTVSVEVAPDFGNFESSVDRQITSIAREIENIMRTALENIAQNADRSADDIAQSFERGGEQVERALDEIERAADGTGDQIADEFQRGGEQAEDALGEVGDRGEREFDRIEREASDVSGRIGASFGRLGGLLAGAFAAVQVGQFLRNAVLEADALGDAIAVSEQIIEQTSGAAGLLAEDIRAISQELSLEIGVDSVQVQEAANVLLTFRNVSSDTFDQALGLAADLSTVLGTNLQGATLQLGKALNDPVRGINALARAGVQFTEAQREQIAAMVESGDILGAQQIILAELEGQVGGTAAVSADSWQVVTNAFRETQRELGAALIPAIDSIAPALIGLTSAFGPVFTSIGEVLGGLLQQLAPIIGVIGEVLAEGLSQIMPAIQPLGAAIMTVVEAFAPLLPVLGQLLGTLIPPLARVITVLAEALAPIIELVAEFAAELIDRLEPIFPPLINIISEIAGVLGGILGEVLGVAIELFFTLFEAVQPLIPLIFELIRALLPMLDPIMELVRALLPPLVQLLTSLLIPLVSLLDPIIQLATMIAEALAPAQEELIGLLTDALVPILTILADVLMLTVVPALEFLTSIMEGDFRGAFENAGGMLGVFRDVVFAVFSFVRNFIGSSITRVRSIIDGVRTIVGRVRGFFNDMRNAIVNRINAAVDFVRGFPRRVLGAIGNLGSLLYSAGRNVIQNLIDGIRSMIGNVAGVIGNVAQTIRDFLPFSPARTGPLSGSGSPERAGETIARMIAAGIEREGFITARATGNLTQSVRDAISGDEFGGAGSATTTGSGGVRVRSGEQRITLEISGDGRDDSEEMVRRLRKAIRVRGGNVQVVLGRGSGGTGR